MIDEVLVDGRTFFVTDERFAVSETGGLFHRDTRYLSELDVTIGGRSLTPIGSHLVQPWRRVVTYADVETDVNTVEESAAQKHTTTVLTRDQVVAEGTGLVERLSVSNHAPTTLETTLSVTADADFRDIFEIRDLETDLQRSVDRRTDAGITFRYDPERADVATRTLTVETAPAPARVTADGLSFDLSVSSQAEWTATLAARIDDEAPVTADTFDRVRSAADRQPIAFDTDRSTMSHSENAGLFDQAERDLLSLVTETPHGPVPLAGVPWFATVFGRDAVITALQTLHVAPALARGTLRYLAAHQGTSVENDREERPGKVFHEQRHGELAQRRTLPFDPYYGTVDATPLWLVLLHETVEWTDDRALLAELWPHAERALQWLADAIDRVGDDPFLYYEAGSDAGLPHKAWRDTAASVQFADGEVAQPPLASVEVQGYAYDAFQRSAELARRRGADELAADWADRAADIEAAFDQAFWLPEVEYYGAALTANGRCVDSVTSNVGHCLWSGLVDGSRTDAVVETLLDEGLDSGWGIRTMSERSAGYSPVSYHVGSVWPHDNAIVALGTSAQGYDRATEEIATSVLAACRTMRENRIPELYCGFDDTHSPHPYPAACEPQAWAAATPFALVRALFALRPGEAGVAVGRPTDAVDFDPEDVLPAVETEEVA